MNVRITKTKGKTVEGHVFIHVVSVVYVMTLCSDQSLQFDPGYNISPARIYNDSCQCNP